MYKLSNRIENDNLIFVENVKNLLNVDLSKKSLCIIKTDFSDTNAIRKICKDNPDLEVWIASEDISRKNVLTANSCGVKNVISYPVDARLVQEFFKDKNKSEQFNENFSPCFLKGLKVMIVDDNQMNIDLLVETLAPLGLELKTFIKPIEASRIVNLEKFDLFLLDIMMPEMSGFDLAKIIKGTSINCNTPIMFISALSDPENKILGYNLGSCAYIEKPFNINVVRSQIYNTLKTKLLQDALLDRKETFLAMVTHDLKSPVNAEICALELLLKNKTSSLDGFQHEIIGDILGAAKYMKNLVENILQKYKCENGKQILHKTMFSLEMLTIQCIEEVKYLLEDKGLKINLNSSLKHVETYFDCLEIKRVIHNLLINAIEYSDRNSKIHINLFAKDKSVAFSITNSGLGISLENPNQIFEKYESFAQKNKSLGTGLGLYISKKIIDAHEGKIYVESDGSSYTTFTFTLPEDVRK